VFFFERTLDFKCKIKNINRKYKSLNINIKKNFIFNFFFFFFFFFFFLCIDHYSRVRSRDSLQIVLRNILRGQICAHMRLDHLSEKVRLKMNVPT